jgi:hypothetical protein
MPTSRRTPHWPGGARLALNFVVNYEEGGERSVLHGDKVSETRLTDFLPPAPVQGGRDLNMESAYDLPTQRDRRTLAAPHPANQRERMSEPAVCRPLPMAGSHRADQALDDMDEPLPNTTITTDATLFREEAERARRYAAAMTDKRTIDRLSEIAALYEELAAGQDPGPTDRE